MERNRILPLSKDVIGQIAAGEVVERPAAAIKELVENSLDAGATAVTVEVREGGISYFRVTDNGQGIVPEDITMAFARHATSKIRTAKDLYGVRSLGFRGEALASIASVAKVECRTRTKDAESGIECVNEGGVMLSVRDSACPEGTSFTVKDLFYNAPVRRKFLKKPSVETGYISELMTRLILSRPDISFRFIADGKKVFFSPGDGKIESAVMSVWGLDTLKMMVPVSGREGGLFLEGYVGIGETARGNRNRELFFINKRAMRSNILSGAVEDACRQLIMIGRFPVCVLYLTIPFENVDVNVHPNKWEVRFQDEKLVRQSVQNLLEDALHADRQTVRRVPGLFGPDTDPGIPVRVTEQKTDLSADADRTAAVRNEKDRVPAPVAYVPQITRSATLHDIGLSMPVRPQKQPVRPAESIPSGLSSQRGEEKSVIPTAEQTEADDVRKHFQQQSVKVIGSVFDTYIIAEYADRMFLCDQHALHERLLYEQFERQTEESISQTMLTAKAIPLDRADMAVFLENAEDMKKVGFDAEQFDEETVMLRGVPMILDAPQAETCFLEAIDELRERFHLSRSEKQARIIQMACKHAVKGGEKLSTRDMTELVRHLVDDDIRLSCPHGRPIMIEISKQDLEKRFKRIQDKSDVR